MWISGEALCYICGIRWAAVVPAEAELTSLECLRCGNMTGMLIGEVSEPYESDDPWNTEFTHE